MKLCTPMHTATILAAFILAAGCDRATLLSVCPSPDKCVNFQQLNHELSQLEQENASRSGPRPLTDFVTDEFWSPEELELEFDEFYTEDGEPDLVDDETFKLMLKGRTRNWGAQDWGLRIRRLGNRLYSYLNSAIRSVRDAPRSLSYIRRASRYGGRIRQAWTVSQGLTDIQQGRDRLMERAYTHGRDRGVINAIAMEASPGAAWIDVNYRAYWRNYGDRYQRAYDAGYNSGWSSHFDNRTWSQQRAEP